MRVAFVNIGFSQTALNNRVLYEPSHLLGMQGICKKNGHQSAVFQLGAPTSKKSIKNVLRFKPDVLGLSFTTNSALHVGNILAEAHKLMQALPAPKPHLLLGGMGVNNSPDLFGEQFLSYYPQEDPPIFVVFGRGEGFMSNLAPYDFDVDRALNESGTGIGLMMHKGIKIFADQSSFPLDDISFKRDYDMRPYDAAQIIWQIGCQGNCVFCGKMPGIKVEYVSPQRALQEVKHLAELGVFRFWMAGPDFTADPKKASAIMRVLPKNRKIYNFIARVDSLYYALQRYPEVWLDYAMTPGRIQLGEESNLPQRLGPEGLRKYRTQKQADKQREKIEYIFDFFSGSFVSISPEMIFYDWKMNLEELEKEVDIIRSDCERYPNLFLSNNVVSNRLHFISGSPLALSMKSEDFYNFKRDPRVLFLAVMIRQKRLALSRNVHKLYNSPRRQGHSIAISLLNYLSICLQRAKEIPVDRLNIEPIVKHIREGRSETGLLPIFYEQLGPEEGESLKTYFEEQFESLFPKPSFFTLLLNKYFSML